jgi:hypothetical protein
MKHILLLFIISSIPFIHTQTLGEKYQYYINKEDIKTHLLVLASDSLGGRATGTIGQNKAAEYIANQFSRIGLEKKGLEDYYQDFSVISLQPSSQLSIGGKTKIFGKEYIYSFKSSIYPEKETPTLLVFSTIKKKELHELDLNNKVVIYVDTLIKEKEEQIASFKKNYLVFSEKGAAGLIYITSNYEEIRAEYEPQFKRKRHFLAQDIEIEDDFFILFGSTTLIKRELESIPLKKWWKKQKNIVDLGNTIFSRNRDTTHLVGRNVIGFIPAKKKATRETLVVMAHYDHLGTKEGEIFNGADDNGTGTSAIIEIAEAFQVASQQEQGLEKNILFMAVSGEELGLLGSRYYTLEPSVPLQDIVTVLNVDMIGRIDDRYDHPNYVYIIGSDFISDKLHEQNEAANKYVPITLDYTYSDEEHPLRLYYRSDHYNFVEKGIPSIFYFGGFHEDYHQPTDTIEKIDIQKVETISRLIFFTAWNVLFD